MDPTNWIFLTPSQVLDAVAFDFNQYGAQPELFEQIALLIPGMVSHLPEDLVSNEALGFFLLHQMETLSLPLETLAGIGRLVFQAPVVCGRDEGLEGVWVGHGMGGFSCARCGGCCRVLFHDCTHRDVRRWEQAQRADILAWVAGDAKKGYEIWVDPFTGALCSTCPWLSPDRKTGTYTCHPQP